MDHCLPVQMMMAAQVSAGMTPGQVAMTPYDSNSPMWNNEGGFQGEAAMFSPLAVNSGEDPANFSYPASGQRSPMGAGGMSPAAPGYNPSSPNVYSPTSPYGSATSPFGTSPYATSPFYDRARGPTSPTSHLLASGVTGAVASEGARSVIAELAPTMLRFNVISRCLVGYYARS